jgi:ABC-type bacteriocin/lantibiotic exporter with double-glycine peptidase domain
VNNFFSPFRPFYETILTVRETETEKKMKKTNYINWTSHKELNTNLDLPARVQRLKRHNQILNIVIATMVGILVPLFFVTLVLACG